MLVIFSTDNYQNQTNMEWNLIAMRRDSRSKLVETDQVLYFLFIL